MARARKVKDVPTPEAPPAETNTQIENATTETVGTPESDPNGNPTPAEPYPGSQPEIADNDPLGIGGMEAIPNAAPQTSTSTSIDTTEEEPDERPAWERYPLQTERRELRVELKMSERAKMGQDAAQLRHDASEKLAAVKAAASAGKATVKAMELRAEKLESAQLRGYDEVPTQCKWLMETSGVDRDTGKPIWHPEQKTLVRLDAGIAVEIVGMTREDHARKELLAAQDTYTPAEGEEKPAETQPMNDLADTLIEKIGYRNVLDSIAGGNMTKPDLDAWIRGICDDNNLPHYDQPDISTSDLRNVVLACQSAAEEDGYDIDMSLMPAEPANEEEEVNEDPSLNIAHDEESAEESLEELTTA